MSMPEQPAGGQPAPPWRRRMAARSSTESHRVATALELLFDLVFVVAVAQAAAELHHAFVEGHPARGTLGYAMVFFAIWWAWMNFTWFASAYDTDDVAYRLAVFVQMTGALVLAAGVPRALQERDFGVATLGYVIMRLAAVPQWLRAAREDPEHGLTCRRYALGITLVQTGWLLRLLLPPPWAGAGFAVLVLAELAVPVLAERAGPTTWHPHHIAERYGLFTIIVLGESILAATVAVQDALDEDAAPQDLAGTALGGLLTVYAMWWLYWAKPAHRSLTSLNRSLVWGYGHYFIYAAAAAVGAGLALAVDQRTGHTHLADRPAAAALTVPAAVFVMAVWVLHLRPQRTGLRHTALFPGAALLVLAVTFLPQPALVTGAVLAALALAGALAGRREAAGAPRPRGTPGS